MGKTIYDFREGLEKDKIIYKKTSFSCKYAIYYILYLLLTWAWMAGWYALFHIAYTYNEITAFWTYIGFWLFFNIILIGFIIRNLAVYYGKRYHKALNALELEKKQTSNTHEVKETERNFLTSERGDREKLNH